MKIIGMAGIVVLLVLLVASSVTANGVRYPGPTTYRITAPPSAATVGSRCLPVCEVRKPLLEYVEDGVALVLDLPLALLSPITCPILSPVMDRLDGSDYRSYERCRRRR
jgi:hypothetical protein